MTDYSTTGVCPNCDGTGTADHPLIPVRICEDCRGTGTEGPATAAAATPGQLDLDQIERTWLVQCGPCDYGLVEMGCNCPAGDYRPVMLELVREVRRLKAENEQFRPAPCNMTHTPPYDFAQCETHDETFPLGAKCRFDGREVWQVFAEEADQQRQRAVRAEMDLERLRAELDAAPGVYQLPAAPPATVRSLWDVHGCRWTRHRSTGHWELAQAAPGVDGRHWHVPVDGCIVPWRTLVAECGRLSTTPPAGTEGER